VLTVVWLVETLYYSWMATGSVPDEVIRFCFSLTGLSSLTFSLGLTQCLIGIGARDPHGFKCGRCVRLTILLPSVSQMSRKHESLDTLHSSGPPLPGTGVELPFYLLLQKIEFYTRAVMVSFCEMVMNH
jgi:hypothetical protein